MRDEVAGSGRWKGEGSVRAAGIEDEGEKRVGGRCGDEAEELEGARPRAFVVRPLAAGAAASP